MSRMLKMGIVTCMVLVASAGADQVVLKNGDRMTGKVEGVAGGKLTLQSPAAGPIVIPLAEVQSFATDEPIAIHLKDGTVLNRKVQLADSGRFAIESGDTVQPQALQIADITAVNPPPKPAPRWTGQVTAGLTKTTGNTHIETRNLSAGAVRRSDNDRITVSMDYARGRQEVGGVKATTEDWLGGRGKYDYYVSPKLYVYGDGRYEKDAVALLDRRVLVGAGAGYQWVETDITKFRTEIGLASLYEKFDNAGGSNSEVSLQAGYNFEHRLTDTLLFVNDLAYYPSLDKFSDYYLTTTAELRASITPRIFGNIKVIFNYDKSPAPDQGSTDVKYILGLGMSF